MKWTLHCDFNDPEQESTEYDFDTSDDNLPKLGECIEFNNWKLTVKQISHVYKYDKDTIELDHLWILASDDLALE